MSTIDKDSTSVTRNFKLVDATTGQPATGLTPADLDLTYTRVREASQKSDLSANTITGVYSSSTTVEIQSTNTPGLYRVDIPDAAFVSGVDSVDVTIIDGANQTIDPAVMGFDIIEPLATSSEVSNIGSGGSGATNHSAIDDNVDGDLTYGGAFVGTQASGTFANTATDPTTYHQINNDGAGNINIVYQYNVGGNRQGVNVLFQGYLDQFNRVGSFEAWDFVGAGWDILYMLDGTNSANNTVEPPMRLLSSHTGTGSEIGDVYVRFVTTTQASADLFNGVLLVSAVNTSQSVGYADGRIWINTVKGTAGTEPYTNGTADNTSLTLADAETLNASLTLDRFHAAGGSLLTLVSDINDYDINGLDYIIDFNGQQASNSVIRGAVASGVVVGNGGSLLMQDCKLGNMSIPNDTAIIHSSVAGTMTLTETGTYFFIDCSSGVAGGNTPSLDFGALGAQFLNFRNYDGGMEIKNMAAGDIMSFDCPAGQFIINASCTGGTVHVRGCIEHTDNSSDAVTVIQDARYDTFQNNGDTTTHEALALQISGLSSGGTIEITNPVADDGGVVLKQGNSYLNADGDALGFTITSWVGPDMDGGTVEMRLVPRGEFDRGLQTSETKYSVNATIGQAGTTISVTIDITGAESELLETMPPKDTANYRYEIWGTPAVGEERLLAQGDATVQSRVNEDA